MPEYQGPSGLDINVTITAGVNQDKVWDATEFVDYSSSQFATMANNGEAAGSQMVLRVPNGTIPDHILSQYVNAHNVVELTVGSNTLFKGYVASQDAWRGRVRGHRAHEIHVDLMDSNANLGGIIVHDLALAGSDVAQLQHLIAAYLSGSPRPSTNLNGSNYISGSNLIVAPSIAEKTWYGVSPGDIFSEIGTTTYKDWYVDVNDNVHYDGLDSTAFNSLLRISDDPDDQDAVTYFPEEPHGLRYGLGHISALRYYYGVDEATDTGRLTDEGSLDLFNYWEDVYFDNVASSEEQADLRAQKLLNFRSIDDYTYTCTIGPMNGHEVYKLQAGQLINLKSRAARGGRNSQGFTGDEFTSTRIREARLKFTDGKAPYAADQYWYDLQLQRPQRIAPFGHGTKPTPQPPTPGTPGSPPTVGNFGESAVGNVEKVSVPLTVGSESDRAIYIFAGSQSGQSSATWYYGGLTTTPSPEALTKVGEIIDLSPAQRLTVWRLVNPSTSTDASSVVQVVTGGSSDALMAGGFYLSGVNQTDPDDGIVSAENLGTNSALTIPTATHQRPLDAAVWLEANASGIADPTVNDGQTEAWSNSRNNSPGRADSGFAGGYDSSSPVWAFGASRNWLAAGIAVNGTEATAGDTTEPVGDTGEADAGDDSGTFSPIDHVHEHGLLSDDELHYHDAADVEYAEAQALEAANVQEAITEGDRRVYATLTNKSGGSVDAGDLVVIDDTEDESFTTTTTTDAEVSIGIAQETIADEASGTVLIYGYAPLINTAGVSQTRSGYVFHGSNAKIAHGSNTRHAGAFGQFLKSGTEPSAWIWGVGDQTASGGGGGGAPDAHATSHELGGSDELDVTGLTGAGGGGGSYTGFPVAVYPVGVRGNSEGSSGASADQAFVLPINVMAAMKLTALRVCAVTGAAGTLQWGLFDCSSDPTACTKVAGGTGTAATAAWHSLAADSSPVSLGAGSYIIILKQPAANPPNFRIALETAASGAYKQQTSYTWDDTPDITTGWSATVIGIMCALVGDLDDSGTGYW